MTDSTTRQALPGERCTCGRPAVEVFIHGDGRETGYCGQSDGGRKGPCPWCGSTKVHIERCPQYRIREEA